MKTFSFLRTSTIVWAALMILTVISGMIFEGDALRAIMTENVLAVVLLSIAFIKARLVIIHFMEVGHSALPLRFALEAWIIITFAAMIFLYFWSPSAIAI